MADKMKDNKDAQSGEPVQLDKEPKQPTGQPGHQQPGQQHPDQQPGQPQPAPQQPGQQHQGGQKR